jgi:hypothetical protein
MICEEIQEELVAYCDGELAAEDRTRITAHLGTCSACSREVAQLTRIHAAFTQVERVTPSPDFAATFWQRLEQEKRATPVREGRFARWWREWRESLSGWQLAPALAGAASILIFFGYIVSDRGPQTSDKRTRGEPVHTANPAPSQSLAGEQAPEVPALIREKPGLFVNYRVIADLEKFSRFDEIAAVQLPDEPPIDIAESDVPKDLLEKPGLFANYPMLQKMEELKNLETVLDAPPDGEDKNHG